MSAKDDRRRWIEAVKGLAADRGLTYEQVGGLNPRGAPAALCPGGSNRITGELSDGFWGASCDALEREEGGLFSKTVVPGAALIKAHMPYLTSVVPRFDVESIERGASEELKQRSRLRVQFESIDFNDRFIATVPSDHDPVALRELFSPGFLEFALGIDRVIDFGALEGQIYVMWRLRELSREELELALDNAGELFRRVHKELEEESVATEPPGPWNAGLEPFPPGMASDSGQSAG